MQILHGYIFVLYVVLVDFSQHIDLCTETMAN